MSNCTAMCRYGILVVCTALKYKSARAQNRKIGSNTYLYREERYRDPATGKVKSRSRIVGKRERKRKPQGGLEYCLSSNYELAKAWTGLRVPGSGEVALNSMDKMAMCIDFLSTRNRRSGKSLPNFEI